jgi:tetratricopeptide (TPR) repeat protein
MRFITAFRRQHWLFAALGVFVVQNHCGMPGVKHEQLAVHLLERGQFERARREAERALRESPDDADMRVIAAIADASLGNVEGSVGALAEALRRSPDDPRLYAALRSLCTQEGCAELALVALQELQQAPGDNWYINANIGWALARSGDTERALPLLEAAVTQLAPDVDETEQIVAHHQLSHLYLDAKRYADAARVLEAALILRPEDSRLLVGIGECHLRQGYEEGAQPYFARALDTTENRLETASLIAQVHYGAGLPRRAIDYYEVAASERTVTPLILNNLAWTYAEEGIELDRAASLSLRAVKAAVDNVVYLDTYAEVLFLQGRADQAIALMHRAIELEPEGGEHFDYLREQLARFETRTASLSGNGGL